MSHGNVYSAVFQSTAGGSLTLASLLTSAASRAQLLSVDINSVSTGNADPERAMISIWRGSSTTGIGAALSVANINAGYASPSTAKSQINGPAAAAPSSASAQLLHRGALGPEGFSYRPHCPPVIENDGQKLHIAIAESTAVAVVGTVVWKEIGRIPGL